MLKRRVTETTLDTYAARIRPADLVASAFHPPVSAQSADGMAAKQQATRPEQPAYPLGR